MPKARLTRERIRHIAPPSSGEITLWDTDVLGLGVRCLPSGVKSYIVAYRAGYGRRGTPRRMTLGKVEALRLEDARERALDIRAQVLKGEDPALERRKAKVAPEFAEIMLGEALGKYDSDQERRGVVNRPHVLSSLRRHLLGKLGDARLSGIARRDVVRAIEALEEANLPSAAKALRGHASTFFKWCADRGMIDANPLAGYRAARATRAQRIATPGRNLSDDEIAQLWAACAGSTVNPVYGALVRMLILSGQRKTETARMRWADVDVEAALWRLPASETKNGIAHEVPLPPVALAILGALPRRGEWVFTTGGDSPVSGWTQLHRKLAADLDAVRSEAGEGAPMPRWTLHDLRRTFRTGLTRLMVDPDVAEIMVNHRPATLRGIYDREPRIAERRQAAERWALHVAAIADPDGRENVVQMRVKG